MFLIKSLEFFVNNVKAIKKALELISPGIIKLKASIDLGFTIFIVS